MSKLLTLNKPRSQTFLVQFVSDIPNFIQQDLHYYLQLNQSNLFTFKNYKSINAEWRNYDRNGKDICSHCVKNVRIRSYSGPHFSAFGLNTERYGVDADQNNSEYGHFLRSELLL